MGYSDLDSVKRLHRILSNQGNNQHKIYYSGAVSIPEIFSNNTGTGLLKAVSSVPTDYAGSEFWKIKFDSPTEFVLFRDEAERIIDGSGNVASQFVSSSGIITIDADEWVGTFAANDKVKFSTLSNISDDDADEFITDADEFINGLLQEAIASSNVPFVGLVPNLIQKASMYVSASIIFTSVFSSLNTDQVPTLVRRWFNLGKQFATLYLESIVGKDLAHHQRQGRFVSRKPLFTKVGIAEVAGVDGLEGEVDTQNVEYDEDFNSKEILGTS